MNDHTLNPLDDPKLTAYALGELGAQEAAEVEKLIADDEAVCAEVEAIKCAAQQLEDELCAQPRLALTDSQRAAIRDGAVSSAERRQRPTFLTSRKFWIGSGLAVAASWVIAIGLPMLGKHRDSVQTAARSLEDALDPTAATANGPLASPSRPLPLMMCISTVSAWSSAVCPRATATAPISRAARPRKA